MVDGDVGSSERCLKCGGEGKSASRDLSKNILKTGSG